MTIEQIEKLKAERDAAVGALRGNCNVCKNKPSSYAFRINGIVVASGKCATCKYSANKMFLIPNSTRQDEDNWVWTGHN